MPNITDVVVGLTIDGEHAWRTDISHVSNKWDNENCFGNRDMRAVNASWTVIRNGVALYSCEISLQLGGVDG